MRHALLLVASLTSAVAFAAACGGSSNESPADEIDGGGDAADILPAGAAGTGLATGLPCDVQAIIESRCIACHAGANPGTPRLLDYADLMAPSLSDPTKSMAVMAAARLRATDGTRMPPPPAVPPEADEIQTFEDWVNAGTPKGKACTDPPPAAPAGGDAGPAGDAGAGTCTSGKTWTDGNKESPLMRPGEACNACHSTMGGPNLRIAGTVYPTAHEPNDCLGATSPPQITVVITDAKNKIERIQVNASGNFQTTQRLSAPYRAVVTDGTKQRAMTGSVTSGDCNSCHTVAGLNGAPGRIMKP